MRSDLRLAGGAVPSMPNTVPKAVTAGIRPFCRVLALNQPVWWPISIGLTVRC